MTVINSTWAVQLEFEPNDLSLHVSESTSGNSAFPDWTLLCVLSGILKDYLRELPSQLITRTLYQVVREAMTQRPPPAPPATPDPELAQSTVELLSCLPPPERVTEYSSTLALHQRCVYSYNNIFQGWNTLHLQVNYWGVNFECKSLFPTNQSVCLVQRCALWIVLQWLLRKPVWPKITQNTFFW